MNAPGTSKVVFAAHGAIVLLPQFDARRERDVLARTDLSSVRAARMGSAPTTQQLIDAVTPGFPIWTHVLFPLTLLSEPRALQPGMSPIQHRCRGGSSVLPC